MNVETASPDLVVVKSDPFNAETPLTFQRGVITPTPRFYVRSHFPVPHIDVGDWLLHVDGRVATSLRLSYADLLSFPQRTFVATLECAGNGRSNFKPPSPGEPWQFGAVSTAEWTGVPLALVLEAAGLLPDSHEVVFQGADRGIVSERETEIPYARSMPVEKALHTNALLAHTMNGEPLTAPHGFPVRLIVPLWFGMASVKWLTSIEVTSGGFQGYYQVDRYVLDYPGASGTEPLAGMQVRSLIVEPRAGAVVPGGEYLVRGYAWSGLTAVESVDVSADGGGTWHTAHFASESQPYAWRAWEHRWRTHGAGETTLRSRAFDGVSTQPEKARWNSHGYANNAIQIVQVLVEGEKS